MTFLIMSVILLSMWQQPELSCELASDIQDIVDWDRKWISNFNAKQTHLVSFDCSNNTSAIDKKIDGSVVKENSSFKILWLTFSSKLD